MAYATTPTPPALDADSQSSLKLATSLPQPTSLQHVVTSLPPGPNFTTASSFTSSPTSTPTSAFPAPDTPNAFTPASTPLQPASEGLRGRVNGLSLPTPGPLE